MCFDTPALFSVRSHLVSTIFCPVPSRQGPELDLRRRLGGRRRLAQGLRVPRARALRGAGGGAEMGTVKILIQLKDQDHLKLLI